MLEPFFQFTHTGNTEEPHVVPMVDLSRQPPVQRLPIQGYLVPGTNVPKFVIMYPHVPSLDSNQDPLRPVLYQLSYIGE